MAEQREKGFQDGKKVNFNQSEAITSPKTNDKVKTLAVKVWRGHALVASSHVDEGMLTDAAPASHTAHVKKHNQSAIKGTCHGFYFPEKFRLNEHLKREEIKTRRNALKRLKNAPSSTGSLLPAPSLDRIYAFNIDTIYHEKQRWLPCYEILKYSRHEASAIADYLSTERVGLQASLKPFVDGLRSGRLAPLRQEEIGSQVRMGSPCIFPVHDAEPNLDLNSVWGMAITNVQQSLIYEGDRKNEPLPFQFSFVREFTSGVSIIQPKYAIDIPLHNTLLRPPSAIESQYHIYHQEGKNSVFQASANIGTVGSVVDIHDDRGFMGLTAMDNTQVKLWALYPPDPKNRTLYERESNISRQYSRCEKELAGGRAALTMPTEAIVIPPGWLHATATLVPGCLMGSTFSVAEGVFPTAQILKHDILTKRTTSLDDLRPFLQSLHAAVLADHKEAWLKAIGILCSLRYDQVSNKGGKGMHSLVKAIRGLLNEKLQDICPGCSCEIGSHFPLFWGASKRKRSNK
ncbi:hypothetical protein GQ44DRAFT_767119 [Phaeosphaeriaceae sp. PMI808]|nr:hypothetical protein GQ44DRAFT_767119 [Phaeosphaeriaceae sp. PMI808]